MVGSPNYIFMVYDADQSTFEAPVTIPPGSMATEDLYESYYTLVGEPYDDTAFDGRSDYQAFILAGIPSGGLFTGAEVPKTEAQEAIWGGTAGEQFDPCYHLACDTFDNVDLHALDVNSDLIAFAQLTFAYSTESVNGVPGKRFPARRRLCRLRQARRALSPAATAATGPAPSLVTKPLILWGRSTRPPPIKPSVGLSRLASANLDLVRSVYAPWERYPRSLGRREEPASPLSPGYASLGPSGADRCVPLH